MNICSINEDIAKRCSDLNFVRDYAKNSQHKFTFNKLVYILSIYPSNVNFCINWNYSFVYRYLLVKENKIKIPPKYDYLKSLIERGNVDTIDSSVVKTLRQALDRSHYNIANLLLKNGADITPIVYDLRKILIEAFHAKDYDMAKFLLKIGADMTPIIYILWQISIRNSDEYLASILKEYSADVNIKNDEIPLLSFAMSYLSQYSWACNLSPKSHILKSLHSLINIVKMIIEAGADVNVEGYIGMTPLDRAMFFPEKLGIGKFLIEHGAVILPPNRWTPLMYASYYGNEDNIKLILNEAVQMEILNEVINARRGGKSALDLANMNNHIPPSGPIESITTFFKKHIDPKRDHIIKLINSYKKNNYKL
jgi:ankyrin repeat protein